MTLKHFYTPQNLVVGQSLTLEPNLAHRLARVLRLPTGHTLALFNGREGLVAATLIDPRKGEVHLTRQLALQPTTPGSLTLAICLPKKDTFDTVLRQATELGITQITPLFSAHAVPDKLNTSKAAAKLIEAAEQCERLTLPELAPVQSLTIWLARQTQSFYWAYERLATTPVPTPKPPGTVLLGPEGGFSTAEIALLEASPLAVPLSLGPTILRVDTAAAAALTVLLR